MEKDDALIKELLKEGFYTKAPDNFTENVMIAVAEEEQSAIKDISPLAYATIFLGAFSILSGILYVSNNLIFTKYSNYFLDLLLAMSSPFNGLFNGFKNMDFSLPFNGLFFGILTVIVLLLGIDRFFKTKRKSVSLFI